MMEREREEKWKKMEALRIEREGEMATSSEPSRKEQVGSNASTSTADQSAVKENKLTNTNPTTESDT